MRPLTLVFRAFKYYRRIALAVVFGVATAVAVLGGALLVGDSVRGSLRDLALHRLGRATDVVASTGFFRDALAAELQSDDAFRGSFSSAAPLIAIDGVVGGQTSGRRAARVAVYGVDDRFWRFHGAARTDTFSGDRREALISAALAKDIGAAVEDTVLVHVARPSSVPIESLQGRKDDLGKTLRLTVRAVLGPSDMGEFSLRPQQGSVRALFVPLRRLQQEIGLDGRVNTILVSASDNAPAADSARSREHLETLVKQHATLDDLGLSVRAIEAADAAVIENAGGLLDATQTIAAERAAKEAGLEPHGVFTYLADTIRSGGREVPYSLVAAVDGAAMPALGASSDDRPAIVLNDWTARDLGAKTGDPLTLDYTVWEPPGQLIHRTAEFRIAGITPMSGIGADRTLAPVYPGLTDSASMSGWDPPFPVDLRRVRPVDEDYWKRFRTTPKAFIRFDVGQRLWRSRYGDRTSVRINPAPGEALQAVRDRLAQRLRAVIDPLTAGLSVQDVRANGLAASRGSTDFGEYFTYFSFFLVISALLLAGMFFKLGVEQRSREVGLLRAVGFDTARIRWQFVFEGLLIVLVGGVVGVAGAIGYAWLMMAGLGSWWSGAVGTDALRLHLSPISLVAGVAGVGAAALVMVWWTLRSLERTSERTLLSGMLASDVVSTATNRRRWPAIGAVSFGGLAAALLAAGTAKILDQTAAFFGASACLLAASLCAVAIVLRRRARTMLRPLEGGRAWRMWRLGLRHAAVRPGRSLLAIAVIASASFILISVDAFRRTGPPARDKHSGIGGYGLIVDLLVPLAHDPNGREGRDALGLASLPDVRLDPFRVRPGDDASCLNLYEPTNPTILGATRAFIESGRFRFQSTAAGTPDEQQNPWLLLDRKISAAGDRVVPVIADANSMTYVLHKALGDEIVINVREARVRLRLVGALSDSMLQSELVMSEGNFLALFPEQEGFQRLLVDVPAATEAEVAKAIEEGGRDLGAHVESAAQRLAGFHQVENTYISTFQALGGLGLLVGTMGLSAVLLRNVLERRKELALLEAVGYRSSDVFAIVLAENVLLLLWGLAIGTVSAIVAVVPALAERGSWLPIGAGGWMLVGSVFTAGLLSSIVATRAALNTPLLGALRAE
jgi:putative ABC transport system permease protein